MKKQEEKQLTPTLEKGKTEKMEYFPIKETPFTVCKKNEEYIIILGQYLCSEKAFKTLEKAKEYIYSKPYELIGAITSILITELTKTKKP